MQDDRQAASVRLTPWQHYHMQENTSTGTHSWPRPLACMPSHYHPLHYQHRGKRPPLQTDVTLALLSRHTQRSGAKQARRAPAPTQTSRVGEGFVVAREMIKHCR